MQEESVQLVSSDQTRLSGILRAPVGKIGGTAVLAHGISVEKNEGGFYTRLAERLSDSGIASLRFDFRGHGESAGRSQDMTIAGEMEDLAAAVGELQRRFNQTPAVIATSFGAGVAVLNASQNPDAVSTLVLLCPVLDYRRTFLFPETEWGQEWFTRDALAKVEDSGVLSLDGFLLGKSLIDEFGKLNPAAKVSSLAIPVLMIHGSEDSMVPFSVARDVSKVAKNVTFVAVEGADHGFEGSEDLVFLKVTQWLMKWTVVVQTPTNTPK